MNFDRIRFAPLGGRVRFVVAVAAYSALGVFIYMLAVHGYGDNFEILPVTGFAFAASGALAYLVQFTFGLFRWVLDGFDEGGRKQFVRFVALCILAVGVAGFLAMTRHEVSGFRVDNGTCRYVLRDRWTNTITVEQESCDL